MTYMYFIKFGFNIKYIVLLSTFLSHSFMLFDATFLSPLHLHHPPPSVWQRRGPGAQSCTAAGAALNSCPAASEKVRTSQRKRNFRFKHKTPSQYKQQSLRVLNTVCHLMTHQAGTPREGGAKFFFFGAIKKGDVGRAGQCPRYCFLNHSLVNVIQPTMIMACLAVQAEDVACLTHRTTPNIKGRKVGVDIGRQGGAVNMRGINHQFKRKQSPPSSPTPHSTPQGRESQPCVCLSFLSSSALLLDNSIPVQGGDPSLHLPGLETKLRLYL